MTQINLRLYALVDEEFAPGELAELKSGGPLMTVVDQCEDCGDVTVQWFNLSEVDGFTLETDAFPAAALKVAEDDEE